MYFLMPLSISLDPYTWGSMNLYIFPFGILCANLEIRYSEELVSSLIGRIESMRESFMKDAKKVAHCINKSLIESPCDVFFDIPAHTMIFVDKTNPSLVFGDRHHSKAITGLIKRKLSFRDFTRDYVSRELSCKLPSEHNNEIQIFHTKTTFLYPKKGINFRCMRNNYADFLNFIFAVNQFLEAYRSRQNQMSKRRLEEIKRAFKAGFPKINSDYVLKYYQHIYPSIAKKIRLDERLRGFLMKNNNGGESG